MSKEHKQLMFDILAFTMEAGGMAMMDLPHSGHRKYFEVRLISALLKMKWCTCDDITRHHAGNHGMSNPRYTFTKLGLSNLLKHRNHQRFVNAT